MSNADISRYGRRIVQYIWDPEPVPEAGSEASKVWCLGRSYRLHVTTVEARPDGDASQAQDSMVLPTPDCRPASPGSGESSFEEIHRPAAVTDIMESRKLVWPDDFLDDFEARIWLTYRSGFAEIAKSEDPAASSKMSLSVRLKSQLTSMTGFTSDTGWGCMIRTGQSLLANSIATLRLGRGEYCPAGPQSVPPLTLNQTGAAEVNSSMKVQSCGCLQTILPPRSRSIGLSPMAQRHAGPFRDSGSDLRRQPSA